MGADEKRSRDRRLFSKAKDPEQGKSKFCKDCSSVIRVSNAYQLVEFFVYIYLRRLTDVDCFNLSSSRRTNPHPPKHDCRSRLIL